MICGFAVEGSISVMYLLVLRLKLSPLPAEDSHDNDHNNDDGSWYDACYDYHLCADGLTGILSVIVRIITVLFLSVHCVYNDRGRFNRNHCDLHQRCGGLLCRGRGLSGSPTPTGSPQIVTLPCGRVECFVVWTGAVGALITATSVIVGTVSSVYNIYRLAVM